MLPIQRTEYFILLLYNFCKSGLGHRAITVQMNKKLEISNININFYHDLLYQFSKYFIKNKISQPENE